jgi:hypothetical protein
MRSNWAANGLIFEMPNESIYHIVPIASLAKTLEQLGDGRGDWLCLTKRGRVLKTPAGIPIAHPNRLLLEAIQTEAEGEKGLQLGSLSIYSMFCTMKDHSENNRQGSCKYRVLEDLTLRLCAGPEVVAQLKRLTPIEKFLAKNHLPRLGLSQSPADQEERLIDSGLEEDMYAVVVFFDALWPTLSDAQQCVVTNCLHIHDVFILGILLVQSECSPEHYADAMLALKCMDPDVVGNCSESDIKSRRAAILAEAKLMLRFRDLAEAIPGDAGPTSLKAPPKRRTSRSTPVRSTTS